jgi:NADP-dependent 3-hydroxy acid dehydrogenase YdfG
MTPLSAADVADAILWAVTRPPHVNVEEILLMPTEQATATIVHRKGP